MSRSSGCIGATTCSAGFSSFGTGTATAFIRRAS
jgi:hypothetical protein